MTRKKLNKKFLNIGALNCHGLADKVDFLEMENLVSSFDIFGVNETWLNDDDEIEIPGFQYYPLNRKVEKGPRRGGLGLFIRDEVKENVKLRHDRSYETFWCKLKNNCFGFNEDVLYALYISPQKLLLVRRK